MRLQVPTLLPPRAALQAPDRSQEHFWGPAVGSSPHHPPLHPTRRQFREAKSSAFGTQMASPCPPNVLAGMTGPWAILGIARVSQQSTQSIPGVLTWPEYANTVTNSLLPGRKGT